MSLRSIAKEMEISPSYLSMLVNGKRQWTPALFSQYQDINQRKDAPKTEPQLALPDPPSKEQIKTRWHPICSWVKMEVA